MAEIILWSTIIVSMPDTLSAQKPTFASIYRGGFTYNFSPRATKHDLLTLETSVSCVNKKYSAELVSGLSSYANSTGGGNISGIDLGGYSYIGVLLHKIIKNEGFTPYFGGGIAYCRNIRNYLTDDCDHYPQVSISCGIMNQSFKSFNINGSIRYSYVFIPGDISPEIRILVGFTTPRFKEIVPHDRYSRSCCGRCAGCFDVSSILVVVFLGLSTVFASN